MTRPSRRVTVRPEIDRVVAHEAQAALTEETGESFSIAETVEHALRRVIDHHRAAKEGGSE